MGSRSRSRAVGDIYVMPAGRQAGEPHQRPSSRHRSWCGRPTARSLRTSDKDSAPAALDPRHAERAQPSVYAPDDAAAGATWSPDGTRLAFVNVTGMWRVAEIAVLDVASGTVTTVHETLAQPGTPTWSPDGTRLALAAAPYTRRFREGTNQVLTMAVHGGGAQWYAPVPTLSIDSRGGCGPVWSPDGTKMAAIYEGVLAVWSGISGRCTAGAAAPHHHRKRARAELAGRFAAYLIKRWTRCGSSTSVRARRSPCRSI